MFFHVLPFFGTLPILGDFPDSGQISQILGGIFPSCPFALSRSIISKRLGDNQDLSP